MESVGARAERSTLFHLEPVPRGSKPFLLPVRDSFENVLNIMQMSASAGKPEKPRMPKPVPVEEIIADLLKEWTGGLFNVPQGAKPGVGEVSILPAQVREFNQTGKLPEGIASTELRQLEEQQKLYFEYLFTEGERLHKQSNWKEITDTMRLAADALDYQREWSHRAIARESGPCPWCQRIIPHAAIVCSYCTRQVKAAPAELAALQMGGGHHIERRTE